MQPFHLLVAFVVAVAVTAPSSAIAQDDDFLRGPPVADDGLIRTDFQGNFIPVQGRPEVAAIALLGLEIERSEQARQIYDRWILDLSDFLIDELELLKKASDATRAGDQEQARQHYIELFRVHEASESRDPLFESFAEILNNEEQQRLRALIDDYWSAWIHWELRNVMAPTDDQREQVRNRLAFQLFQDDIGQAFRIALQSHSVRLERIYAIVEPTDAQRTQIREIVLDYVRQTRLTPETGKQQEVTAAIFELLTKEQRKAALDYAIWQ